MNVPFEAICINDQGKPEEIPASLWVKKGVKYTVIKMDRLHMQGGILGFKLEELNIDNCIPYSYFASHRFAVLVDETDIAEDEAIKELLNQTVEA